MSNRVPLARIQPLEPRRLLASGDVGVGDVFRPDGRALALEGQDQQVIIDVTRLGETPVAWGLRSTPSATPGNDADDDAVAINAALEFVRGAVRGRRRGEPDGRAGQRSRGELRALPPARRLHDPSGDRVPRGSGRSQPRRAGTNSPARREPRRHGRDDAHDDQRRRRRHRVRRAASRSICSLAPAPTTPTIARAGTRSRILTWTSLRISSTRASAGCKSSARTSSG